MEGIGREEVQEVKSRLMVNCIISNLEKKKQHFQTDISLLGTAGEDSYLFRSGAAKTGVNENDECMWLYWKYWKKFIFQSNLL